MKTVLVTGASSGIGEAYARWFAKEGSRLVLVSRNKERLEQIASEIKRDGSCDVVIIQKDLAQEHAAEELYGEIRKRGIVIDILINNAGFSTKGLFTNGDFIKQHEEMNLNMVTLTELCYFALDEMAGRGEGLIINVASCSAFSPIPYNAVYSATKAYVLSLSSSLSYEYREKGIRIIAVCPGATNTHFFDEYGHGNQKLREPEDVVATTVRAIRKGKNMCTDGVLAYLQSLLPHLISRKRTLRLMGRVGKSTWGNIKERKACPQPWNSGTVRGEE